MGRLIQADRRATLTEITTCYNRGMQKSICKATARTTLRWMDYNSRRPHWVPLQIGKRGYSLKELTKIGLLKTRKMLPGLMRHSEARVRIWRKQNENMDPSCLVTTVQAGGGVMVWEMFSRHTLGPLVPIGHHFNATAHLSIVSDHVHPFMPTMFPSSDGYIQQDNALCHKAQIISNWFLQHDNEFTVLKWPPQSPDLNPIEHLWDVVERELHALDVHPTNLHQLQHLVESVPHRIKAVLKVKGGQTRY